MEASVDVGAEEGIAADAERLESWARRMLDALSLEAPELSVWVTHDVGIQALNAAWRKKDEPTDVLSFPQQEGRPTGGLLGDLVISLPTADAQARALGHDLEHELRVLLAHGIAHLLGYDHEDDAQATEMKALEARLLAAVEVEGPGLVERAGAPR